MQRTPESQSVYNQGARGTIRLAIERMTVEIDLTHRRIAEHNYSNNAKFYDMTRGEIIGLTTAIEVLKRLEGEFK